MKRWNALWSVVALIALQAFGQGILWDLIWDSGLSDTRVQGALWFGWTLAQLAFAAAAGVHLTLWGLRTFSRPHAGDRLPAPWANRFASPQSRPKEPAAPRSAILSA